MLKAEYIYSAATSIARGGDIVGKSVERYPRRAQTSIQQLSRLLAERMLSICLGVHVPAKKDMSKSIITYLSPSHTKQLSLVYINIFYMKVFLCPNR